MSLPRKGLRRSANRAVTRTLSLVPAAFAVGAAVAGCGNAGAAPVGKGQVAAVGAENEYANVISQIGGRYVAVTAIESNPNTDPHTYEASPSVAQTVGSAQLLVQNGLGYDTYMSKIEAAQPSATRKVIDVQTLLGLPDSSPDPHLWYKPGTMPAVARAVGRDLAALQPAHAAYFARNETRFETSLTPWLRALRQIAVRHPRAMVAVTEPVGDYLLQAAGAKIVTPFALQAAIMNGTDPAPQDVTLERQLLSGRRVKVLLYNQQVTDTVTETLLAAAKRDGIPVVGVYETMPVPGYDYQSWMLAETEALGRALSTGASTERLR